VGGAAAGFILVWVSLGVLVVAGAFVAAGSPGELWSMRRRRRSFLRCGI